MALSLLLLRISVTFILLRLYETKHQTTHCITVCAMCTAQRPSIVSSVTFVTKSYNFDSAQMTEIKTSKIFHQIIYYSQVWYSLVIFQDSPKSVIHTTCF